MAALNELYVIFLNARAGKFERYQKFQLEIDGHQMLLHLKFPPSLTLLNVLLSMHVILT